MLPLLDQLDVEDIAVASAKALEPIGGDSDAQTHPEPVVVLAVTELPSCAFHFKQSCRTPQRRWSIRITSNPTVPVGIPRPKRELHELGQSESKHKVVECSVEFTSLIMEPHACLEPKRASDMRSRNTSWKLRAIAFVVVVLLLARWQRGANASTTAPSGQPRRTQVDHSSSGQPQRSQVDHSPLRLTSSWSHCSDEACCASFFPDEHVVIKAFSGGSKPRRSNSRTMSHVSFHMAIYGSGDIVSKGLRKTGRWEPPITARILQELARASKPGNRAALLDIGANLGWHTYVAAAHGYNVVAFEPFKSNRALHHHTLCLNPKFREKVKILPYGLHFEDNVTCSLYQSPKINIGDTHVVCGNINRTVNYLKYFKLLGSANMRTIDSVLGDGELQFRQGQNVIGKIDVEGFEFSAWKGASQFMKSEWQPLWIISEMNKRMLQVVARSLHMADPERVVEQYKEMMDGYGYDLGGENHDKDEFVLRVASRPKKSK